MTISIPSLPEEFLQRVRLHGIDDQGQPVKRVVAEGGEPCRDVLRRAKPGEELILASFSPFTAAGPYKEFGPVFLLAQPSDEATRRDALPTDGYLREQFVIRAYSKAEEIINAAMVSAENADEAIRKFASAPETAFLHVRFPVYGCFACRVDLD